MGDIAMRKEVEADLDTLVGMSKVKDFFQNLRETVEYVKPVNTKPVNVHTDEPHTHPVLVVPTL